MLVRIFLGEGERWHRASLVTALVERLRREGYAGATVIRGIEGFGAKNVLHAAHHLRLSEELPVLIEVVDTEERAEKLLPILDEMVTEGLVTMEPVRVVRYLPSREPAPAS